MPIYEYVCRKCGHKFEQLQKITDKPQKTCPECGKKELMKLVSNTSFQLKGTGWYITDFKNKKTKEETTPIKKNEQKSPDKKKVPEKNKK